MNIDEFIRGKGADASSVFSSVARALRIERNELLIAVGSLAEGMGTSKSDLDLILITPVERDHTVPVSLVIGKCLVDVRILPRAELEALLGRFEKWAGLPWDVVHSVRFTLDERTLLHRLLRGRVLYPRGKKKLPIPLPASEDLARLKLHVARQMVRTIQVDMAGYREIEDYRSLAFAAQEVLGHTADALVAPYGYTNPLLKWRSRLLDLVPPDWEASMPLRPSGMSASERFWSLSRLPASAARRQILTHAMRISAFARAVFAWAETRLVRGALSLPAMTGRGRTARGPAGSPLPFLDLDVDFLLSGDGAELGRLNETGRTLRVTASGLSLALLFDGVTTPNEASLALFGSSNAVALAHVTDIVSSISGAGFCC